jgi:RHS repeat-associated protein
MRSFQTLLLLLFLYTSVARADWEQIFSEKEDPTLFHNVNVISGNLNLFIEDTKVQGVKSLPITRTYTSAGAISPFKDKGSEKYFRYLKPIWQMENGWSFFSHTLLFVQTAIEKKDYKAYLPERSGSLVSYTYDRKINKDPKRERFKHEVVLTPENGHTQHSGVLSARTNPENNVLTINNNLNKAILLTPDGGERHYELDDTPLRKINPRTRNKFYFRLVAEILPSKERIEYSYEKRELKGISFKNPAGNKTYCSIKFDLLTKLEEPYQLAVRTSDGKSFKYSALSHKERDYLATVESDFRPGETLLYHPARKGIGARIQSFHFANNEHLKIGYYLPEDEDAEEKWANKPEKKSFSADKVQTLKSPVGPNGETLKIAEFFYEKNHTDVRDVDGLLIRYHHDGERLKEIQYFGKGDHLNSSIRFFWDGGRLRGKALLSERGQPLFAKTFQYDEQGNVLLETLWGNLTGRATGSFSLNGDGSISGAESFQKRFAYLPHFNVPVTESEEEGPNYHYQYLQGTDLLSAKFTRDHEKIMLREFYVYNSDHLLVEEIKDDGTGTDIDDLQNVTTRQIKRFSLDPSSGLAKSITESYWDPHTGKEELLKRVDLTYTPGKQIQTEAVYDADGVYRYTLHTDYDLQGRIIRKTTPSGQENLYKYDRLGNLLEVKEVGSPKKIYTYDAAARRPILCEEIHSDKIRSKKTQYDAKGRILSETDSFGNTTLQTYDAFGKCTQTQFSPVKTADGGVCAPTAHFTYDEFGNLASHTSPKDETTSTVYNALRKPIQITQADGTVISHLYNKNGTLAKTFYPDETEIHYTYDLFQRMRAKKVYSKSGELLSQETWEYNSSQLVSYTDDRGLVTTYEYDGAGRKISETAGERKTLFVYDSLGFLHRTNQGEVSQVQMNDVEGRIVEQWSEDFTGRVENRMAFIYDREGRKERAVRMTSQGEAIDFFSFDDQGRLLKHTDPHGELTQFIYDEDFQNDLDQRVLQKTTIDPIGNRSVETYDALNRLVQIEKQDPSRKTVAKEELFYDISGNKIRRESTVYLANTPLKTTAISWEHDPMGRVIKEIEGDQKTTLYSYDNRGRIEKKILPRGISLFYTYDGTDRLLEERSSDRTVHYQYFYEQGGSDPTQIIDRIQNIKLLRSYNQFGELIQEVNAAGLASNWTYDHLGRCTQFILPNRSSVSYQHVGTHLTFVKRHSSSGHLLYTHHYNTFDPNGHVSDEKLIFDCGSITTHHDLLERPKKISSRWMNQEVVYGPSGLVMRTENSLIGEKNYAYDALNQLLKENDTRYLFDSLGNPSDCETNSCNQILSTPHCKLHYDPDGNPCLREEKNGPISYSYDALGRLTSITHPKERKVLYTYDPLSRLLSKELLVYNSGTWQQQEKLFYLYDKELEVGAVDENGTLLQFKVLGLGLKGDRGSAVAIETQDGVFAPLHDFSGNIVALVTPHGKIAETYKFDAFGREVEPISTSNPWRFCSKRYEEGFIFFGLRFYDPSLGRWLTPDPSGFTDSANLYLYVLNSPLNRLDLFGLNAEPFPDPHNFQINVPIVYFTPQLPSASQLILCKGIIGTTEVDFVVSCGHWHKLEFTPEERLSGSVNLIDHLHELTPSTGAIIGFVSAQNGMNNKQHEFVKFGQSVVDKIYENPLFIGIYNPNEGLIGGAIKVELERQGHNTDKIDVKRQFYVAFAESLHKINPQILWLNIDHSEAGLLSRRAIEGMTPEQQKLLRQHLILLTLGSALPVPRRHGLEVRNIYSKADYLTKFHGKDEKFNSDFHIHFVPCTSKWTERTGYLIDHAILGGTYQSQLNKYFDDARKMYGFYGEQTR